MLLNAPSSAMLTKNTFSKKSIAATRDVALSHPGTCFSDTVSPLVLAQKLALLEAKVNSYLAQQSYACSSLWSLLLRSSHLFRLTADPNDSPPRSLRPPGWSSTPLHPSSTCSTVSTHPMLGTARVVPWPCFYARHCSSLIPSGNGRGVMGGRYALNCRA